MHSHGEIDRLLERTKQHLLLNSQLNPAPGKTHVQFVVENVEYYMPQLFHLAPTIHKSSTFLIDEHLPLRLRELFKLKKLQEVYFHNYRAQANQGVMMLNNWPVNMITILGKVMDIIEPLDRDSGNWKYINDAPLPFGKIRDDEYVISIEDGSTEDPVAIRMSPFVFNKMMADLNPQSDRELRCFGLFRIGWKVQAWGFKGNSNEFVATKMKVVGGNGMMSVEISWWKMCQAITETMNLPWHFQLNNLQDNALTSTIHEEESRVLESIINKEGLEIVELHDEPSQRVFIRNRGISYSDYLEERQQELLYFPEKSDHEMSILEFLISVSLSKKNITLAEIYENLKVSKTLHCAILANIINIWSTISSDFELIQRWKYTDICLIKSTLIQKQLELLTQWGYIIEVSEGYSLKPIYTAITIIKRKLILLPHNCIINGSSMISLLNSLTFKIQESHINTFLKIGLKLSSDEGKIYWSKTQSGWKREFRCAFSGRDLYEEKPKWHGKLPVITTDGLKRLCFKQYMYKSEASYILKEDDLLKCYPVSTALNTLIFAALYKNFQSLNTTAEVADLFQHTADQFADLKRHLITATMTHFEDLGITRESINSVMKTCKELLSKPSFTTPSQLLPKFYTTLIINYQLTNSSSLKWTFSPKDNIWSVVT